MKVQIPQNVIKVIRKLEEKNFEAFVVGGCVRDLLLGIEPSDWDVTTNATPEQIQEIFPDSVYENQFGTVGVKVKSEKLKVKSTNKNSKFKKELLTTNCQLPANEYEIVEVTTYRIESKYSDKRHPDKVRFAKTLKEDLSRRDFTINAIALQVKSEKRKSKNKNSEPEKIEEKRQELIDLFSGQKDLKNKVIRVVGDANERFDEDALRMMRAIRFACQLNGNSKVQITNSKQISNSKFQIKNNKNQWCIEKKTLVAIKENYDNLEHIAKERIRDEFNKIILSSKPAYGVDLLAQTKLMKHIMPEIGFTIGVKQNRHHYYGPYNTVYAHMLASLEKCPSEKLEVRLAAFLHDIGKPKTKSGEGEIATFHAHEYAGAKIVQRILSRLKYPRKVIDKVVLLVKNHMFYYNVDEVGDSGVRKVVRKVGLENINDLIDVRIADRLGSGVPKAVPYKLRHFKYMVEKVSHDAISVKQLKINGDDLMKDLKINPGPKIGAILDVLLARVIDEPKLNTKKELLSLAKKLEKEDLLVLRKMAKEKIKKEREKEDEGMRGKYWVK